MPTAINNVQVTRNGTVHIQNGTGNLHDDHDANSYIIVRDPVGGIRLNALVRDDLYRIEYDEVATGTHRVWLSMRCYDPNTLAEFRQV